MKKETVTALLIILALLVIVGAISWAITTALVYLVCICFSYEFSLATTTSLWLIGLVLYGIFCRKEKK